MAAITLTSNVSVQYRATPLILVDSDLPVQQVRLQWHPSNVRQFGPAVMLPVRQAAHTPAATVAKQTEVQRFQEKDQPELYMNTQSVPRGKHSLVYKN
jgi:hypothetical protein